MTDFEFQQPPPNCRAARGKKDDLWPCIGLGSRIAIQVFFISNVHATTIRIIIFHLRQFASVVVKDTKKREYDKS